LGSIVGVNTWKSTPNASCINRASFNNCFIIIVIKRINYLKINQDI
jgi:hypothetical protein